MLEQRRQVLVVEDDSATRAVLRRTLAQEGWLVEEAENGKGALARLSDRLPDLILLDLMMPEMDGFAFLEALRTVRTWQAIPVVVITAKDLSAEDRRRLNGGVEQIIQKAAPDTEVFLNEIRDFVGKYIGQPAGAETDHAP